MPSDYLGTVREFLEALRIESLSQNPGIPAQQTRSAIPISRPATHSPTVDRLPLYKHFAFQLDDALDADRDQLAKLKKQLKALHSAGSEFASGTLRVAEQLEKYVGSATREASRAAASGSGMNITGSDLHLSDSGLPLGDPSISLDGESGLVMLKFLVATKELANLLKLLMQSLFNQLIFPLDTLLKQEMKHEQRRLMEKAMRQYDALMDRSRRERDSTSGDEVIELRDEMDRSRHVCQLQLCEYLTKLIDIKLKKDYDLAHHFVEYSHSQNNFHIESERVLGSLNGSLEPLVENVQQHRQTVDAERRSLQEAAASLRSMLGLTGTRDTMSPVPTSQSNTLPPMVSNSNFQSGRAATLDVRRTASALPPNSSNARQSPPHPLYSSQSLKLSASGPGGSRPGSQEGTGVGEAPIEKSGVLLKRSKSGAVKIWQRRRATVRDGHLELLHTDSARDKDPLRISLLTAAILPAEHKAKGCFKLVSASRNRKYYFQVEDPAELKEWMEVLNAARQAHLERSFEQQEQRRRLSATSLSASALTKSATSLTSGWHEVRRQVNRTVSLRLVSNRSHSHLKSVYSEAASRRQSAVVESSREQLQGLRPSLQVNRMSTIDDEASLPQKELCKRLISAVRSVPGNDVCCDCGAQKPDWISTNLGVLICLECCGLHRELGVHFSRTQSLVIDDLKPSQLLLARVIGNTTFNEVFEASLNSKNKLKPSKDMGPARREFIMSKYVQRKFIIRTSFAGADGIIQQPRLGALAGARRPQSTLLVVNTDLKFDLRQAVCSADLSSLLQVYAEGMDLLCELDDTKAETSVHLAINEHGDSFQALAILEFIIQNSPFSSYAWWQPVASAEGRTPAHLCCELNAPEVLRLLLRHKPSLRSERDLTGRLPLDVARSLQHADCISLLEHLEQCSVSTSNGKGGAAGSSVLDCMGASGLSWRPLLSDVRGFGPVPLATLPRPGGGGGLHVPVHGGPRSRSHSTSPEQTLDSAAVPVEPYNVVIDVVRESLAPPTAATPPQAAASTPSPMPGAPLISQPPALSALSVSNQQSIAKSAPTNSAFPAPTANIGYNQGSETRSTAPVKPHPPHSHILVSVSQPPPQSQRQTPANTQPQPGPSTPTQSISSQQQQQRPQAQPITSVADVALRPNTNAPIAQQQTNSTALVASQRQSAMINKGLPPPVPANKPVGTALQVRPGSSQPATSFSAAPPVNSQRSSAGVQSSTGAQKSDGPTQRPASKHSNVSAGEQQNQSGSIATTTSPTHMPVANRAEYVAGRRCVALFDCEADNVDELSFRAGQVIRVLNTDTAEEDWVMGELESEPTRKGLFPCNFVQPLADMSRL